MCNHSHNAEETQKADVGNTIKGNVSPLFSIKMVALLESTPKTTAQNNLQSTTTPGGSNNKQ